MYRFSEKIPDSSFYWLFLKKDGTYASYKTNLKTWARFQALYGTPYGTWSYTPKPMEVNVTNVYEGV